MNISIINKEKSIVVLINETTEIELVLCPAGCSFIGSPLNEIGRIKNETRCRLLLTKDFYIGKYPITQAQYKALTNNNPSRFIDDNNPVENISYFDALNFYTKLNRLTEGLRIKDYYFGIPTEPLWEYACRAGSEEALHNNANLTSRNDYNESLDEIAWYDKNSGKTTHPVGQKKTNAWGIYDMLGNVWEWCSDSYYDSYATGDWSLYPNQNGKIWKMGYNTTEKGEFYDMVDPEVELGGKGFLPTFRGGSYSDSAWQCRSARRNYTTICDVHENNIGFRIIFAHKLFCKL